jgi:hypothetical protein
MLPLQANGTNYGFCRFCRMLPFIMFNCFLCSSDEDYTGKPDGGGFAVSIGKKKIFLFFS